MANRFDSNDSWTILSPVEQSIKRKIEAAGVPLKEWDVNIYRGVLTGYNEAFIIGGDKRQELISADPKSAEIIRPILRGRDIKRYEYDFADLWLIYVPWHFPLHLDPTISGVSLKAEDLFQSQYPAIYKHLEKYKKSLSNRNKAETGVRYEWYALQRWGANYTDDFSKQKIVWGNLCLNAQYALADEDYFINAPATMIVPGDKYLLAILNSKVADFYIRSLGVTRNGGYFEYKPMFIEKLPVIPLKDEVKAPFITCVNEISEAKKQGISSVLEEQLLDGMIYDLYCLDEEEILFLTHSN